MLMKLNLLAARILCALLTAFTSLSASAYSFEVDGIYYKINSSTDKTVAVTSGPRSFQYTGKITIPSEVNHNGITYKVTSIESAFQNSSIEEVSIPDNVTEIICAFSGSHSLKSVELPKNLKTLIGAFMDCTSLISITIPEGIEKITGLCFTGCSSLQTIIIPESVTFIETSSIDWCTSLPEIRIPDKVETIGEQALEYCTNLKKVEIGIGIKTIEGEVFRSCHNLELITINAIEPPTAVEIPAGQTYGGTFDTWHYENTDLRVPAESIEKYRTAPVWENFFKDRNPLTGIENVEAAEGAESEVVARYDLSGRPVADDYRGMTIVRRADGSTAKEILR